MIIGSSPSLVPTNHGNGLSSLQKALNAIQDADTALLTVKAVPQSLGALSRAMQLHREAALLLHGLLQAGGGQ